MAYISPAQPIKTVLTTNSPTIPAIKTVAIEIAKTDAPNGIPSYQSTTISVSDSQLIDWNIDRMTIIS